MIASLISRSPIHFFVPNRSSEWSSNKPYTSYVHVTIQCHLHGPNEICMFNRKSRRAHTCDANASTRARTDAIFDYHMLSRYVRQTAANPIGHRRFFVALWIMDSTTSHQTLNIIDFGRGEGFRATDTCPKSFGGTKKAQTQGSGPGESPDATDEIEADRN